MASNLSNVGFLEHTIGGACIAAKLNILVFTAAPEARISCS